MTQIINLETQNILYSEDSVIVKVRFKSKKYLLVIDQILRLLFIFFYLVWDLSHWVLFTANIILAFLDIIYFVIKTTRFDILSYLNEKYVNLPGRRSKITIKQGTFEISKQTAVFLLFNGFIFTFWFLYTATDLISWWLYIIYILLSFIGGFLFLVMASLLLYPTNFKADVADFEVFLQKENELVNISKYFPDMVIGDKSRFSLETVELDPVDYNDTRIAKLESDLKGINSKVDAYLLESVLLGALSFSGFLTIVSGNVLNDGGAGFSNFCSHVSDFFVEFRIDESIVSSKSYSALFRSDDLFILIMFMCLFCSVFFLLVLTLRMRYMSLSLKMDHLIRIMSVFNAKEEELTNIKLSNSIGFPNLQEERLNKIIKKVDFAISDANKLMLQLNPVVAIMSSCRNIAIIIFYTVLIFSGFYFSPFIGLIILIIAIMVILARWIETLTRFDKINILLMRHK